MAAIQVEWLLAGVRDSSGQPLNAGKVYTYEAGTTTPKATYQDADKSTSHANPIVLDSNGRKLVYAEGAYKFIVHTSADVLLYTFDDLTYRAETGGYTYVSTSGGSANAQTLSPSPAPTAYTAGDVYKFIPSATNTSALTLNVSGLGAKSVKCPNGDACIGGEVASGQVVEVTYNGTNFILTSFEPVWTNWTPTYSTDAGTLTLMTTAIAQFKHWGDRIEIILRATGGSLASADADYISATLPKNADLGSSNQLIVWPAYCTQSSPSATGVSVAFIQNGATGEIRIYKDASLTTDGWDIGSGLSIATGGTYKC